MSKLTDEQFKSWVTQNAYTATHLHHVLQGSDEELRRYVEGQRDTCETIVLHSGSAHEILTIHALQEERLTRPHKDRLEWAQRMMDRTSPPEAAQTQKNPANPTLKSD